VVNVWYANRSQTHGACTQKRGRMQVRVRPKRAPLRTRAGSSRQDDLLLTPGRTPDGTLPPRKIWIVESALAVGCVPRQRPNSCTDRVGANTQKTGPNTRATLPIVSRHTRHRPPVPSRSSGALIGALFESGAFAGMQRRPHRGTMQECTPTACMSARCGRRRLCAAFALRHRPGSVRETGCLRADMRAPRTPTQKRGESGDDAS
jgi:hypothetical protein